LTHGTMILAHMQLLFFALSLTLFFSCALVFWSRNVRLAVGWAGLWSLSFGVWLVAPVALDAHHLYPQGVWEWVAVFGVLGGFFVVIGTLLSLLTSWPLAATEWRPHWRFRRPGAATAAWSFVLAPVTYLGLATVLEWSFFSGLSISAARISAALIPAAMWGAAVAGLVVWCRRPAGTWLMSERTLAGLVVISLVVGGTRLPLTVQRPSAASDGDLPVLTPRAERARRTPLLVIGLDGGNWRTLDPLIDAGRVPTLARLAANGVRGEVEALWPPYWSTPAWGSVVTGHHRDVIGVHENLGATAPFLPPFEVPLTLNPLLNPLLLVELALLRSGVIDAAPAARQRLRRAPVWERLTGVNVKTGVVFFPFTYPAVGQTDYVVSNRALADIWDMMGIQPGAPERLISPAESATDLLPLLTEPLDSRAVLRGLLPDTLTDPPRDAPVNPVEVLEKALDVGQRMFNVTEQVIAADPDLELVMLYVGDFDSISHAFWPYRFPDDYPDDRPAASDISRFGPVIDRYLEHLDHRIGRVMAMFPAPPNVVIVADHGIEPSRAVTLWKAWHSRNGLFLAGGPDITGGDEMVPVSYFDVVPTILDLLGFAQPSDLRGRSVVPRRSTGP
jgi:hypothetical protein